jgi:hypothetical protein
MAERFLAMYEPRGDRAVVDPVSVADHDLICRALRANAQQLTREANGRKWAGEHFKAYRARLREEARAMQRLASSLDSGHRAARERPDPDRLHPDKGGLWDGGGPE